MTKEYLVVLMDPKILIIEEFSGSPLVGDAGSYAIKALIKSIKEFGQREPVMINDNKVVVVGRRRVLACRELGTEVKAIQLSNSDAQKALREDQVRRRWSVADTARFLSNLKVKQASVENYVRDNFGWTSGFCESNVQRYRKIAKLLDKHESVIANCDSLNEAMKILENLGSKPNNAKKWQERLWG